MRTFFPDPAFQLNAVVDIHGTASPTIHAGSRPESTVENPHVFDTGKMRVYERETLSEGN
jgi:hypothetical protein